MEGQSATAPQQTGLQISQYEHSPTWGHASKYNKDGMHTECMVLTQSVQKHMDDCNNLRHWTVWNCCLITPTTEDVEAVSVAKEQHECVVTAQHAQHEVGIRDGPVPRGRVTREASGGERSDDADDQCKTCSLGREEEDNKESVVAAGDAGGHDVAVVVKTLLTVRKDEAQQSMEQYVVGRTMQKPHCGQWLTRGALQT